MIALKKIWVFLKTHWYIPVIIIIALVLKSQNNRMLKIIDASQKSYNKQKHAIEAAEIEKKQKNEEIEKEHQRVLAAIERATAAENRTLQEKEKKLVKKLVKKYYNNPKEMSEEISKVLGLTHVKNNKDSSD